MELIREYLLFSFRLVYKPILDSDTEDKNRSKLLSSPFNEICNFSLILASAWAFKFTILTAVNRGSKLLLEPLDGKSALTKSKKPSCLFPSILI